MHANACSIVTGSCLSNNMLATNPVAEEVMIRASMSAQLSGQLQILRKLHSGALACCVFVMFACYHPDGLEEKKMKVWWS